MIPVSEILAVFGYVPEDDSWDVDGRLTYSHDEDASLCFMRMLSGALQRNGWSAAPNRLRTFISDVSAQIIEIEPGGSGFTGHLLHHMKARDD